MAVATKTLVITGGVPAAAIVITRILVSVPTRLSAVRVTFVTPVAEGVPLMVFPLKVRPPGKFVALKVTGAVPVAVMV